MDGCKINIEKQKIYRQIIMALEHADYGLAVKHTMESGLSHEELYENVICSYNILWDIAHVEHLRSGQVVIDYCVNILGREITPDIF